MSGQRFALSEPGERVVRKHRVRVGYVDTDKAGVAHHTAYLVWLGIRLWRAGGSLHAEPRGDAAPPFRMLVHAWLVTALNPKSLTFFIAFLPQFIDHTADFWTQMLIFEATFVGLAFANAVGYGLVASRAHGVLRSERAVGLFNRAGGALLIGAGVAAARMRSTQ